jgi:[ribosomal protein S5]-alanine N-acetyltransferase
MTDSEKTALEPVHIETQRLRIREWTEADQPAFVRIITSPEVARWSGEEQGSAGPRESFIRRMSRNQRDLGWALWAVELLDPEAEDPAGPIGYAGFGTEMLPVPELAWTFLPAVWGRGYATEAGIASRDYGFRVLHMTRMVSVVDRRNSASARVAEKVGLVLNGTIDCHGMEHFLFEIDIDAWHQIRRAE